MRGWVLVCLLSVGCAPSMLELAERIPHHQAQYSPTEGDDLQDALLALTARAQSWGFTVEQMPPEEKSVFGTMNLDLRLIRLQHGMPINGTFEVLAHEMCHIVAPRSLDRSQSELFAELCSVDVAKFYGYDGTREHSAGYSAGHKGAIAAMKYLKVDLRFAVRAVTGQVNVNIQ